MIYWDIFLAFLIPGVVGYGGGPASIGLVQYEVVNRYGWMSVGEFGEIIALANTLPGPIGTKLAGYVGYEMAGIPGALVALFAYVSPSLIAMVTLLGLLYKFKDSPRVKSMTGLIKPAIAILLAVLAFQFFETSWFSAGVLQTILIGLVSLWLLERVKVHPAFVIVGALLYGALVLPFIPLI